MKFGIHCELEVTRLIGANDQSKSLTCVPGIALKYFKIIKDMKNQKKILRTIGENLIKT